LKEFDSYGFKKLEIEEYLRQTGINYLSIRLSDVIGPFDETLRSWKQIQWLLNSNIYPVQFDKVALN
jgi:nucleoside-diphosphate-sugar epimerase